MKKYKMYLYFIENRVGIGTLEPRSKQEDRVREIEQSVEQYLRRRVEALGGRCEKFIPDVRRGWPDRVVLLPAGVLVWVETKRPVGGRVSGAQRVAHEDLRRLGQDVRVICTREQVDEFIEEMKKARST